MIVICVDNKRVPGKLTVGKEYKVLARGDTWIKDGLKDSVCVQCDDNKDRWYSTERFQVKG